MSVTHGAFSRAGADQSAYLIDYCPTGSGVPRTRRLIVLDGDAKDVTGYPP